MKKFTLILFACLFWGLAFNTKAQGFIKIDASFYSEALDEVKKVDVYLPPDYYVNTEQYYATVYYLHGAGGNQNEGNTKVMYYYYSHDADTTISSPPAIFVCPDGSCEPYMGSGYINSVLYGNYEDYIMQDVIEFVEHNFRALADKNFRYITGWSMGGMGASRLSVIYPDQFRASVPCIGFLSYPDTMMNFLRTACYEENGSYQLDYNAGPRTMMYFTMAGGLSPNMDIEPYHIEIPFDTSGNWVDTVVNKWYSQDPSRKVKDLPDENELAWFLICGTQDDLVTYPTYQVFMDSLDFYNISYDSNYFNGGHMFDPISWLMASHWLDSIIDLSYHSLGIDITYQTKNNFDLYPNPCIDQLNISYTISKSCMIRIDIFDQYGKQIANICQKNQHAGSHKEYINIQGYTPGIYFCRLMIGDEVLTKKIIKR